MTIGIESVRGFDRPVAFEGEPTEAPPESPMQTLEQLNSVVQQLDRLNARKESLQATFNKQMAVANENYASIMAQAEVIGRRDVPMEAIRVERNYH